jgi:hypothetical protein
MLDTLLPGFMTAPSSESMKWLDVVVKVSMGIIGPALVWGVLMIFGIKEDVAIIETQIARLISMEARLVTHVAKPAHEVSDSWHNELKRRIETLEKEH